MAPASYKCFEGNAPVVYGDPIDPAQTRAAVIALLAAHAFVRGRLPSKAAVLDLINLLAGEPRSELGPEQLQQQRQRRYKDSVRARR